MKVRSTVKANFAKGDKQYRRRGLLFIYNKNDRSRNRRQKGKKKIKTSASTFAECKWFSKENLSIK